MMKEKALNVFLMLILIIEIWGKDIKQRITLAFMLVALTWKPEDKSLLFSSGAKSEPCTVIA